MIAVILASTSRPSYSRTNTVEPIWICLRIMMSGGLRRCKRGPGRGSQRRSPYCKYIRPAVRTDISIHTSTRFYIPLPALVHDLQPDTPWCLHTFYTRAAGGSGRVKRFHATRLAGPRRGKVLGGRKPEGRVVTKVDAAAVFAVLTPLVVHPNTAAAACNAVQQSRNSISSRVLTTSNPSTSSTVVGRVRSRRTIG
jgi:hypothetical protein